MVAERTGTRSLATLLATNVLAEGAGVLEYAKPAKSDGSSLYVYCGHAVNESVNETPASPGSRYTDATGRVRSGGVRRPMQAQPRTFNPRVRG